RAHHAADGGLCNAREVLGENSAIDKYCCFACPVDAQELAAMGFFGLCGRDFDDENFQNRFETSVTHGNLFVTNEKLRVKGGPFSQLETPTVNDNQSAQFAALVTGDDIRLGRRQKDCGDEHGQPDDGGKEAASEAERENDQGCSGDSQENAEEHPRARVAPQVL